MSKKQRLAILGSTGSIGTQTLEIIRQHPESFEIILLSANTNSKLLAEQIQEFKPAHAVLCSDQHFDQLTNDSSSGRTVLHSGIESVYDLITSDEIDTVLNSLVGFAGFIPTYKALKAGKKVALANKESLVVGGELIMNVIKESGGSLVPVDSEHSAMLQSLVGERAEDIEKIVITASGGPFREYSPEEMKKVTRADALKHPNWDMGAKITIDSSTMMNKGLEIIEAHWLFDLPIDKIEPVIHPQSIIHSMVTFIDGSTKAQLGPPDMRVPIIYALTYPDRGALDVPRMNWSESHHLTFEPVDTERFPCVRLAMNAAEQGGVAPAILNASNEVAVSRFLKEEIAYIDIPVIVEKSLERLSGSKKITYSYLKEIDAETRAFASTLI